MCCFDFDGVLGLLLWFGDWFGVFRFPCLF